MLRVGSDRLVGVTNELEIAENNSGELAAGFIWGSFWFDGVGLEFLL
jgi:hypothetical protein